MEDEYWFSILGECEDALALREAQDSNVNMNENVNVNVNVSNDIEFETKDNDNEELESLVAYTAIFHAISEEDLKVYVCEFPPKEPDHGLSKVHVIVDTDDPCGEGEENIEDKVDRLKAAGLVTASGNASVNDIVASVKIATGGDYKFTLIGKLGGLITSSGKRVSTSLLRGATLLLSPFLASANKAGSAASSCATENRSRSATEIYVLRALFADDMSDERSWQALQIHVQQEVKEGEEGCCVAGKVLRGGQSMAMLPFSDRQLVQETKITFALARAGAPPLHSLTDADTDSSTGHTRAGKKTSSEEEEEKEHSSPSSSRLTFAGWFLPTPRIVYPPSTSIEGRDWTSFFAKAGTYTIPAEDITEKSTSKSSNSPVEVATHAAPTPPPFAEDKACVTCDRVFSFALFRHHCRNCGGSFCTRHSPSRRPLLHFGLHTQQRVCLSCRSLIDEEGHRQRLLWRRLRTDALLKGHYDLLPYVNAQVHTGDRAVDKLARVVEGAFSVLGTGLYLSYPVKVLVDAVGLLRRYGLSGLTGLLMRRDFVEAAEVLKDLGGLEELFASAPLHELSCALYYKMALDRGKRGCRPEEEHLLHLAAAASASAARDSAASSGAGVGAENEEGDRSKRERESSTDGSVSEIGDDNDNQKWPETAKADAAEVELTLAVEMAPLALAAVYQSSDVELQRVAASVGYRTLFACLDSRPEQPAHAVFVSGHEACGGRVAVVCVRGTSSVHDVVTDVRTTPVPFPPNPRDVEAAARGDPLHLWGDFYQPSEPEYPDGLESGPQLANSEAGADVKVEDVRSEVGPTVLRLLIEGYKVVLTGHSLGGAVCSLLTHLLLSVIPALDSDSYDSPDFRLRCVAFAPPCCMCSTLAEGLKAHVLTVVLRDDVVARLTPQSVRKLMKEVLAFQQRGMAFDQLEQDWGDLVRRAGQIWGPRFRKPTSARSEENKENEEIEGEGDGEKEKEGGRESVVDSEDAEAEDDYVSVEEHDIADLWLPGRVLHIYAHRGRYLPSLVSRSFPTLRSIQCSGNMFTDHGTKHIFNALLEARSAQTQQTQYADEDVDGGMPPQWMPFDASNVCLCCENAFTWHSTFSSLAQEYRDKHNCRMCGRLVCGPCSLKSVPIQKWGMVFPVRICDTCFYKGSYI